MKLPKNTDEAPAPPCMSLRDYFAGQAMNGHVSAWAKRGFNLTHNNAPDFGAEAYAVADAMLKARDAKP